MAGVAKALSYLYAAMTLHLAIRTGDPLSELGVRLADRTAELAIDIPSTHDICGHGDAVQCIRVIGTLAAQYRNRSLGW